jgi:hypothetical protein
MIDALLNYLPCPDCGDLYSDHPADPVMPVLRVGVGKRQSRRENTPRQQRDAISAAIDADHLDRVAADPGPCPDQHETRVLR